MFGAAGNLTGLLKRVPAAQWLTNTGIHKREGGKGFDKIHQNMTFIWKAMKTRFLVPRQACRAHPKIAEGLGTNGKYFCVALSLKYIYASVNVSLTPVAPVI